MKKYSYRSKRFLRKSLVLGSVGVGVLAALLATNARAATSLYFDSNGTTAGYGASGSWDSANWATASGGTSTTGSWVAGDFARFYSATSGTVTVGNTEVMAGLYEDGGAATTVTINQASSTSGDLSITTVGESTVGPAVVQGFLCEGSVVINCPIVGACGIEQELSENLSLFGVNTYAGGTDLTGGQVTYYNNNSSFGTGPIVINGSAQAISSSAAGAVTIANPITILGGTSVNLVGGTAGTTYTANIALPTSGSYTINTSVSSTSVTTLSGTLSGAANLVVADAGTLILAGNNTMSGTLTVGGTARTEAGNNGALGAVTQVIMSGGILDPGGYTLAPSATLSVTANSIIDFEAGDAVLAFNNSSAVAWTAGATLTINDWLGVGNTDLFVGTDSTGLTAAQLADIDWTNVGGPGGPTYDGAQYTSGGELIPVTTPEPSTIALGVIGGLGALWNIRRKKA